MMKFLLPTSLNESCKKSNPLNTAFNARQINSESSFFWFNEFARICTRLSFISGGIVWSKFPIFISSSQIYPVVWMTAITTFGSWWLKLLERSWSISGQLLLGNSIADTCEMRLLADILTCFSCTPSAIMAFCLIRVLASREKESQLVLAWFYAVTVMQFFRITPASCRDPTSAFWKFRNWASSIHKPWALVFF